MLLNIAIEIVDFPMNNGWFSLVFCRFTRGSFFPQQRELMGSSAQNSSGVHWCRRRVRRQRGSGKSSEGSGEGLGGIGAEPAQVQQGWEKVPEKVPEKAGEGLGGFGAEPGQIQQGSEKVLEKVPEKVGEALVQSQVKFNRVPEKVPGKVWEASVQSQVKFNRVPEKVPEKVWEALVQRLWCRARSGLTGFAAI